MRDLLLDIDRTRKQRSLEAGLRAAIRAGRLEPGEAVPSSRGLAADLELSRATVVAAYDQLVAEGYLASRPGALTRVAAGRWSVEHPVVQASRPDFRLDLIPGEPDSGRFPRAAWLRCTREVLATAPNDLLGYGNPSGLEELRAAIASYLNRTRNTVATADSTVVVPGAGSGLGQLARLLHRRGATDIAVEEPGFPFHHAILQREGLRLTPVPVDDEGIDIEALAATALDRRRRHARSPVSAGHGHEPRAPHEPRRLGAGPRRVDHRGRLRRRVPLRPSPRRLAPRLRTGPSGVPRHHEQDTRGRPARRLARRAARAARADRRTARARQRRLPPHSSNARPVHRRVATWIDTCAESVLSTGHVAITFSRRCTPPSTLPTSEACQPACTSPSLCRPGSTSTAWSKQPCTTTASPCGASASTTAAATLSTASCSDSAEQRPTSTTASPASSTPSPHIRPRLAGGQRRWSTPKRRTSSGRRRRAVGDGGQSGASIDVAAAARRAAPSRAR